MSTGSTLPAHEVVELAALDVEDKSSDHLQRRQVGRGGQQLDILPQRLGVVVDREEAEVGAGELLEVLVGHAGETAVGVLHDDDGVDPEHLTRQGQTAQDVFGHPTPGIADHVGFTEVEAEDGEHIDAGVHAGHDGQVPARAGVGHVGPGGGVSLVGLEEFRDLAHGTVTRRSDADSAIRGHGTQPSRSSLGYRRRMAAGCVRVCGCKSRPVAGKTTHVRQLVVAEHGAA